MAKAGRLLNFKDYGLKQIKSELCAVVSAPVPDGSPLSGSQLHIPQRLGETTPPPAAQRDLK